MMERHSFSDDVSQTIWLCKQSGHSKESAARLGCYVPSDTVIAAHHQDPSWRVYPFVMGVEDEDTIVLVDHDLAPIARLGPDLTVQILDPNECVELGTKRWFYGDKNSPLYHPETFDRLDLIVRRHGLRREINYRSALIVRLVDRGGAFNWRDWRSYWRPE
jgi:hypothetical protein